jgi:hypothetical protein
MVVNEDMRPAFGNPLVNSKYPSAVATHRMASVFSPWSTVYRSPKYLKKVIVPSHAYKMIPILLFSFFFFFFFLHVHMHRRGGRIRTSDLHFIKQGLQPIEVPLRNDTHPFRDDVKYLHTRHLTTKYLIL